MKTHISRRTHPSFGYRGPLMSHSNAYSYYRRPPFSKMKEVYGESLERFELEKSSIVLKSKKLLAQHKKEIRYRIQEENKKGRNRNIILICLMTFMSILFLFFINHYFLDTLEFLNN